MVGAGGPIQVANEEPGLVTLGGVLCDDDDLGVDSVDGYGWNET